MFKIATLKEQGGQTFKVANVQGCQRMATLKSADTAIQAVRATISMTRIIFTGGTEAHREGLEGLRAARSRASGWQACPGLRPNARRRPGHRASVPRYRVQEPQEAPRLARGRYEASGGLCRRWTIALDGSS